MAMQIPTTDVLDFGEIKLRQQTTWGDGDYAQIGVTLQSVGERLAEGVDVAPGERVLDVAAGNGNFTLAAARCLARVTSTDYVASLLTHGRARAAAEGFDVAFRTADAEDLPFTDDSFDVVGSTFGVMFTPDQHRAASELVRVCRPGGRIGLANWTPDGFIGQLFVVVGRYVPPPAGVPAASLWGDPDHLETLFGDEATRIRARRRHFVFRDFSAPEWIERFRRVYGPVKRAFEALDETGRRDLDRDLRALIERFDASKDATMRVSSEYLEIVVDL